MERSTSRTTARRRAVVRCCGSTLSRTAEKRLLHGLGRWEMEDGPFSIQAGTRHRPGLALDAHEAPAAPGAAEVDVYWCGPRRMHRLHRADRGLDELLLRDPGRGLRAFVRGGRRRADRR